MIFSLNFRLEFSWHPNLLPADRFCFYVQTIQACPSVRRFQFSHWWKVQIKLKFLIKTLFTFWEVFDRTRAQPGELQREVWSPARSCSETSRLDCCRREADCYHILQWNARVTYANMAISHPSPSPGVTWSRHGNWDESLSIQLLGLVGGQHFTLKYF